MSPNLQDCPNEIVEAIVRCLPLPDIRNLRLCSRDLAAKSSQIHFKSFFHSKRFDITERNLEDFVHITQPGFLGLHLQHLVLVGVVHTVTQEEFQSEFMNEEQFVNLKSFEKIADPGKWTEVEKGKLKEVIEARAQHQKNVEVLERERLEIQRFHDSGASVKLLSQAFENLRINGTDGRLVSLSLEVMGQNTEKIFFPSLLPFDEWKLTWRATAHIFHATIRSLSASRLPIENFNVFNNPRLQRCSVACNELCDVDLEDSGLAASFASLKSLSMSISTKDISPTDESELRAQMEDDGYTVAFAKVLQLCPNLKELELHRYALDMSRFIRNLTAEMRGVGREGAPLQQNFDMTHFNNLIRELPHERLLKHIGHMDRLPKLERLELRGIRGTTEDLLAIMQRCNPKKLSMRYVHLWSGEFRPLFDFCTSEASDMEEIFCDNLHERKQLHFDASLQTRFCPFRRSCYPKGDAYLLRIGMAEMKMPIIYHYAPGSRPVASPALYRYRRKQRVEYGP